MNVRISLACALAMAFTAGVAAAETSAPVHPDTLPTLQRAWALPASLASGVTNVYAPRMTLSGKTLYVYDHNGRRLAAVDAEDGKVRWHRPIRTRSDATFAVKPLVARGRVYVASDGYLHCLSAKGGKPRWQVATRGTAVNGIARSKRHIVFPLIRTSKGAGLRGVYLWSVNSRNGRVEWTRKLPGALGYARGNSDGIYYISDNGMVMGMTPDRGEPRWQLRIKGRVSHPPILKGGKLYVVTQRRKAGWSGSGLYVVDARKGKLLWKRKVSSTTISPFLMDGKLGTVDGTGLLTIFDAKGKPGLELKLDFGDPPQSLAAAPAGKRVYLFSYHPDGNGYVHLIDLANKRVLAKANALDLPARSIIPSKRIVYVDGGDGQVYAYRLDRSERPKRRSVPADEFAAELLAKAEREQRRVPGLPQKLAALGPKTVTPLGKALASKNPYVVEAAAHALGLLKSRRSVPTLIGALSARRKSPAPKGVDPLLAVVDALARIRDGRAVKQLQALMEDSTQNHHRRRNAYVALGAIGSSAALSPIWKYRAIAALNTMVWDPQPRTATTSHGVESDWDPEAYPDKLRKKTRLEIAGSDGRRYALSLSPYLGGNNDVWLGEIDPSNGRMLRPLFTGLTKAEVDPRRRLRLDRLAMLKRKARKPKKKKKKVKKDGDEEAPAPAVDPDAHLKTQIAEIRVRIPRGKTMVTARPVKIPLTRLLADRDKDGLPDIVERRLQLCVTHPDCDGDGIKDGEDVNPLASGKQQLKPAQKVFREAFFAFYSFFKRRGLVVVDPGDGPSFELYGRKDPIISLRRPRADLLRKSVGLHAVDYVSFGGPYPEGAGFGDALPKVVWGAKGRAATMGMDVVRSGDNAAGYNIKLRKVGRNWVVTELKRVWSTTR